MFAHPCNAMHVACIYMRMRMRPAKRPRQMTRNKMMVLSSTRRLSLPTNWLGLMRSRMLTRQLAMRRKSKTVLKRRRKLRSRLRTS